MLSVFQEINNVYDYEYINDTVPTHNLVGEIVTQILLINRL